MELLTVGIMMLIAGTGTSAVVMNADHAKNGTTYEVKKELSVEVEKNEPDSLFGCEIEKVKMR